MTTYKRAYQNYNQRANSSVDGTISSKKTDLFNGIEENDSEEQIDTIQLEEDRRQPPPPPSQSGSLNNSNKLPRKPSADIWQPPSSHKQRHRVETMQLSDDDASIVPNVINGSDDEHKEMPPPSAPNGDLPDNKSRRIRRLQHKLSIQEEETKKKFDELQSKQSRLENALKLLVKQTATFKKRQENTNGSNESKHQMNIQICFW